VKETALAEVSLEKVAENESEASPWGLTSQKETALAVVS
jgi:hypothetical protein